jgi:type IV pilus assembly protein PilM
MARDEKPESIWKKELSFRRKSEQGVPDAAEPGNELAPEASNPLTDAGRPPIWKKEISLRKKPKDATVPPVEPLATESTLDPDLYTLLPELLEPVTQTEPEPEPAPAVVPALSEAQAVPAPGPTVEHSWLTQPLEEVSEPPVAPLEPAAALHSQPAPTPQPQFESARFESAPVEQAPVEQAQVEQARDVDLGLELPPGGGVAGLASELPREIRAEAKAPEAAPVPGAVAEPDESPKVPFYRRELSLKRTPGERKPKAEKPRKPERERPAKAERVEPEAGEKVPFYKRELSLKRAPKQWDAAEPLTKSKQTKTKATKEPKEAKPKEAKPKQAGPKLRRPPRPKPSLPAVSRGGGGKKLVGLKIGGSQIAAARVNNGASPELVQAVRAPLEHGIVVGGELRDPDALAAALKAFFNEHKLPKRGVRLGIANNRIGVRTFEVVGIDDPKQLANAIRFRAQEVLPIPLEDAVLDYQVLSEFVNAEGQPVRRVLLVVAYRELVDRYVYACQKAGLQIVGIDLEAFALLRAIAAPHDPVPGSERAALVAVSVGHDRSTFAVSDGRVCEFTRVLDWGGWSLNIAIARAIDTSPSEAEPVKRALSFAGHSEAPEGFSDAQLASAREAAGGQLQGFARELVSSLQFYQNQPGSLSIGEIALTGGTAHLRGLGAELERLVGVPVRVADPLARLKMSANVREQDQVGSLAVAIGLGIDD